MTVPHLETPRLRLRGLDAADTEALVRVFADPEMSRFLRADLSDPAQCRASLARRVAYTGPDGTGHWVIERDGAVIGLAHLRPSAELSGDLVEIGYFLDRAHGGQGLATEAASALMHHGFAALGLPAVWALIHESNVASQNLVRRLGFTDVGCGEHYGGPHRVCVALPGVTGRWHHVELRVPDLARARTSVGWLLAELGWREHQRWHDGVSWKLGAGYLVLEQSPALSAPAHDRRAPGLNHLALYAGSPDRVDALAAAATERGWRPLFADCYRRAGGPDHYAAYLENADGLALELVADSPRITRPG
ncbi:GNAT family N-acetyltransferase [Amycolatopsis thermophila]|uniref:RimJ/RimL family protein N-acetyltransferase/catechol 2,3-dioxygenase-like lactoylglutathione lyase family enzyme n=1 Tax=Amycolatopsis thermophila TaxID=206084 RepID=A0ABU0F091_9PSEU|nr:GNAT family N-acetyltransferase [Amycolatopsis thermophila]MDQ0380769.1 RimJ/RimL family protein N-acetyltransferase/catechol 2,3-dioxygenase-like lactoylglutathione lyase family enzyme [Amycolatopsis thermophila]